MLRKWRIKEEGEVDKGHITQGMVGRGPDFRL